MSIISWPTIFPLLGHQETHLVSSHAILFHLLKFALQLILALSFLLCTPHIHLPPIQLWTVHLIHSLKSRKSNKNRTNALHYKSKLSQIKDRFPVIMSFHYPLSIFMSLKADKTKALGFTALVSHDTDTQRRAYKIKCTLDKLQIMRKYSQIHKISYHICQTGLSACHQSYLLQSSWCKHWWTLWHGHQAQPPSPSVI